MREEAMGVWHTCDGCGVGQFRPKNAEPAYGFYMTVSEISAHGGDGRSDIFACSKKCRGKAIDNVFARRE